MAYNTLFCLDIHAIRVNTIRFTPRFKLIVGKAACSYNVIGRGDQCAQKVILIKDIILSSQSLYNRARHSRAKQKTGLVIHKSNRCALGHLGRIRGIGIALIRLVAMIIRTLVLNEHGVLCKRDILACLTALIVDIHDIVLGVAGKQNCVITNLYTCVANGSIDNAHGCLALINKHTARKLNNHVVNIEDIGRIGKPFIGYLLGCTNSRAQKRTAFSFITRKYVRATRNRKSFSLIRAQGNIKQNIALGNIGAAAKGYVAGGDQEASILQRNGNAGFCLHRVGCSSFERNVTRNCYVIGYSDDITACCAAAYCILKRCLVVYIRSRCHNNGCRKQQNHQKRKQDKTRLFFHIHSPL